MSLPVPNPQLYTLSAHPALPVSVVAYLTGRSTRRVYQWLADGRVEQVTIAGAVFVSLPSLLTYLDAPPSQLGKVTPSLLSLPSKHRRRL